MKLIQLILIPLLIIGVVVYFARFRSRLLDRVLVLAITAVGTAMISMPEWTNDLAHFVDVGRGADLITYLVLIGLTFLCLMFYSELRVLKSLLTDVARAEAIAHAHAPKGQDDGNEKHTSR